MPDIPSTSPDEQEQTQLATAPSLQAQANEQPAPSDVQTENQEATTILADQQESGFQLVMFAPGEQPVEQPPVVAPQAVQPALIPPPITAPPLPLPTSTKPPYRTSPLVKGILIVQ